MLHQRNLKTLSLGRDKKVRADKLFEVFRTDDKDLKSTKGVRASSASNSQAESSSWTLADQSGSDEDLGFTEDTLADPAVVQEIQKAKQPMMPALTKEEAEEAAETWRVEGSSRAGFKVGLHFYAFDCQPRATKAYESFEERVRQIGTLMEKYAFLKGAIINEVGMLNCGGPTADDPICVPDSGKFPAKDVPDFGCSSNEDLPDGLATFISEIVELAASVTTSDGRPVVKSFSWFNIDRQGGTYNLRLFNDDGSINKVGDAYMRSCEKWGEMLL